MLIGAAAEAPRGERSHAVSAHVAEGAMPRRVWQPVQRTMIAGLLHGARP